MFCYIGLFLKNLAEQPAGGQTKGIVFVSDPQLPSEAAQNTAEQVLASCGMAVMTGIKQFCADDSLSCQRVFRKAGNPILISRNEVFVMTYKTIVIDYASKAKKMAVAIEKKANEMAQAGWELVTFSVTNSSKAILVFRVPEDMQQEATAHEGTAPETVPQEETSEAVGETE